MNIFMTGPIKDMVEVEVINVQYFADIDQLKQEITRALPDTLRIPFRISVNGHISETQTLVNKDDQVELITLLQGG